MTYALGIDVGTTFTAAALWRAGRAETVPLGDRANTVPSVLFLRHDRSWLVGEAAERRAVAEPARVAREFKRRVGDPVPVVLGGEPVTPQTLTGQMIGWVVGRVAEREGGPPGYVTLTCPANWGAYRRGLMTEAAATAGLGEVGLVTEPAAAAIHYASQERLEPGALVGVYDLGGGTFDAAVLRKTEGGFELVGQPAGDDSLGGVDFDQAVMDHVAGALGPDWSRLDLADPVVLSAVAQVRANVVGAKEALSSDLEAGIAVILPGVTREVRLTRAELEERIRGPLLRTIGIFRQAMGSAGVSPEALHAVLLVGGSSRIPLVSELIAAELGVPVAVDAHPKFAVCLGAAITAAARLAERPAPAPAGAGRADGAAAHLLAEAPAAQPPAAQPPPEDAVEVDLAATGLLEPADTPLPEPRQPEPVTQEIPVIGAAPRRRPVLVAALALAVVLGLAGASRLLAASLRDDGGQKAAGAGATGPTAGATRGGGGPPATTPPPFQVKINFQDPSAPVPPGYLKDFGEPYGPRRGPDQGRGLVYGWVKPGTHRPVSLIGQGRDRNMAADQRVDTLIHMDGWNAALKRDLEGSWEIKVPNGAYAVMVSVGDQTRNSTNVINVEGVRAIDGFKGTATEDFQENIVRVVVRDGRLTVDSQGGHNTKLNFVEIIAV